MMLTMEPGPPVGGGDSQVVRMMAENRSKCPGALLAQSSSFPTIPFHLNLWGFCFIEPFLLVLLLAFLKGGKWHTSPFLVIR